MSSASDENSAAAAEPPPRRSLLTKVLLVLAAGSVLLLVVAGVMAWWTYSRTQAIPDFYAEADIPTEAPVVQEKAAEVKRAAESLFQRPAPQSVVVDSPDESADEQPVAPPPAEAITLTESQLNAFLIAQEQALNAELSGSDVTLTQPRLKLSDGEARFGLTVKSPQFAGVLSADVQPKQVSPTAMVLTLDDLRVGRMPVTFSMGRMLSLLNVDLSSLRAEDGVKVAVTDGALELTLDWSGNDNVPLQLESLDVAPEGLTIVPAR